MIRGPRARSEVTSELDETVVEEEAQDGFYDGRVVEVEGRIVGLGFEKRVEAVA